LKLYYEYLEEVVAGLRKEKSSDLERIQSLTTEISALKEKERNYLTLSYHNTKNNEENGIIDTIAKIKNRLSLNNDGEFYANYAAKRIDK
jgi:hypothetical protein